jgi:hypothetical protein
MRLSGAADLIVSAGTPTQTDTVAEGVDDNWSQKIYPKALNNKHVAVTGAYVKDEAANNGWTEIHPVTSIAVIQ